ncbi:MAG: hypothetical protein ACRCYE_06140 [Sarcina sp.]
MKHLKFLLTSFIITLIICTSNIKFANASMLSSHKTLYTTQDFNIYGEHLNLIINSISKNPDNLFIDIYLLNNDNINFTNIKDFHLKILDGKEQIVVDDVFLELQLTKPLKPHAGARVILTVPLENKKLDFDKLDFSNITYNFSYNYISN